MFSELPLARKNVEKVNFQVDLSGSQLGEADVPHDGSMVAWYIYLHDRHRFLWFYVTVNIPYRPHGSERGRSVSNIPLVIQHSPFLSPNVGGHLTL